MESNKVLILTDIHRGFSNNTAKIHDKFFAKINETEKFDFIIVSGDWGTSKTSHVIGAFKAMRKAFPDKKIYGVLGNHDLWDREFLGLESRLSQIKNAASVQNIHLLENNPADLGRLILFGFNGWYYHNADTNDAKHIPKWGHYGDTYNYLRYKADKAVEFILDYPKDNKKVVVVTHFPIIKELMDKPQYNGNPHHGDVLKDIANVLIYGHTHNARDEFFGKLRVINAGTEYNKFLGAKYDAPSYKIVEL